MSCQDDAKLVGPVSLFLGIETANWSIQQFIDIANWSKSHGVTTLFIKCAEVGSPAGGTTGWWYGGQSGFDKIYLAVSPLLNVIPYIFPYGNTYGNLAQEVAIAKTLMQAYGKVCLDMEQSYWVGANGGTWAKSFADVLTPMPGLLWLSHPANPVESNQLPFMQAISPATNVFMPMVYNNYLMTTWQGDLQQINPQACIQPTIDLSQEFGANDVPGIAQKMKDAGILAISLWYEGFAKQNPGLLDQIVQLYRSEPAPQPQGGPVILNTKGMVLDVAQSFQLESGESEDLCGMWSVGTLKFAGLPGKGPRGSAENVDVFADAEADIYGSHVDWPGSSISDMYHFLTDAIEDFGPTPGHHRLLHWQDITPDVNVMRKAVQAGYPVIFTANEQNIIEKKSGQRAYPWNLNANHVLPVLGIDRDGDFICADQLNNAYQGYWPPVYLASRLNPSWATVVQVVGPDPNNPWLRPIPSGDPLSWPVGFNAQAFAGGGNMPVPTGWKDDGTTLTAPNNVPVRFGMRVKVMAGWDANNYPMKPEVARDPVEQGNPALGAGSWQNFRQNALAFTSARGVYVPWIGQELQWYMDTFDSLQKERAALAKQVADLQAQLQAATGGIPQVVLDDITSLASHVTPAATTLEKLVNDAGLGGKV